VWQGEATPPAGIEAVMQRAARALPSWHACGASQRSEVVRSYGRQLETGRREITELISREVGKLGWDAAAEVGAAIAKIALSIESYQQRRREQWLDEGSVSHAQRRIRYRPLGVSLVLGPFNFPLHLPGGQIVPALLSGNTVVFKPSEQATAVGHWMVEAWRRAGLPPDVLQMITGGVSTATAAIDSPHVAGVFLTGSRAAGRAIHRQLAGRPGVLLALELGGNNPIVVTSEVPAETVAAIVSHAAFVSVGQRCTCARRAIFVDGDGTAAQIAALLARTRRLAVGMPGDDPTPQLGPLISAGAAEALQRTQDRLLQLGCEPLLPFRVDARAANLVHPAIVDASPLSPQSWQEIGQLEWFGPLLVVQRVKDFESGITAAAATPYGLSAALLGGTPSMFDRFVTEVGAGVVNWNGTTTGAAGALPFGGLGDSGNHRPAGYFAIDFCSDPVASLENSQPPASDPWSMA
jgi:succinylglutamic semialdehyde dehydrogenase